MNDLDLIYKNLQSKYDLVLTNTLALNDGYTIDTPVIRGVTQGRLFDLYEDGDMLVFSFTITDTEGERHSHIHPYDTSDAIDCIERFMSGEIF